MSFPNYHPNPAHPSLKDPVNVDLESPMSATWAEYIPLPTAPDQCLHPACGNCLPAGSPQCAESHSQAFLAPLVPPCSTTMPGTLLPQGLCTGCSICLEGRPSPSAGLSEMMASEWRLGGKVAVSIPGCVHSTCKGPEAGP